MTRWNIRYALAAVLMILIVAALACDSDEESEPAPAPAAPASAPAAAPAPAPSSGPKQYDAPPALTIDTSKTYTAFIELEKGGEIEIELHADKVPNTVNNFVFLAREGFYDGVTFHRVLENFMAQTGDPTGTGSGGPGYRFGNEFHPRHPLDGERRNEERSGHERESVLYYVHSNSSSGWTAARRIAKTLQRSRRVLPLRVWAGHQRHGCGEQHQSQGPW